MTGRINSDGCRINNGLLFLVKTLSDEGHALIEHDDMGHLHHAIIE